MKKINVLFLILISLLVLSSCNVLGNRTVYVLILPDESTVSFYAPSETFSGYSENNKKIYDVWSTLPELDLQIFFDTESGTLSVCSISTEDVLFREENAISCEIGMNYRVRGDSLQGETLWVCLEEWDSINYPGYIDGTLERTLLWEISLSDFSVLSQKELPKDELFLMMGDEGAYVYRPSGGWLGKEKIVQYSASWEETTEILSFRSERNRGRKLIFDLSEPGMLLVCRSEYNAELDDAIPVASAEVERSSGYEQQKEETEYEMALLKNRSHSAWKESRRRGALQNIIECLNTP